LRHSFVERWLGCRDLVIIVGLADVNGVVEQAFGERFDRRPLHLTLIPHIRGLDRRFGNFTGGKPEPPWTLPTLQEAGLG
jgi:hypothetical protein